jgi:hypothetical protein
MSYTRVFISLALFASTLLADRVHLRLRITPQSTGITPVAPDGDGHWIVSVDADHPLAAKPEYRIEGSTKIHESLRNGEYPPYIRSKFRGDDMLDLIIAFHHDVSADLAQQEIDRIGGQVLERSDYFEHLTVRVRVEDLTDLAKQDWVRLIEPNHPPHRFFNNSDSAAQIKVDQLQTNLSLNGTGTRIGIVDGLVDLHPEFGDRLTQVRPGTANFHGTHVAGTLAAAGSSDPRLKGMAPAARILSYTYSSVNSGIAANLEARTTENVDLVQNSWGGIVEEAFGNCNQFSAYTTFDRDIDRIVFTERVPIVFAVGNTRDQYDCAMCARAGFYTLPPPGVSKNAILVGAVDRNNATSTFSSFGPTRDGRIKPDIVALGVSVRSTSVRNTTQVLSGTSMSAPAVSGLAGLLIDRFRQRHGQAPSPELLRGILLNTANDLGNPGPDYSYGFGIPDGLKAVDVIDSSTWRNGEIQANASNESTIDVPGGAPALRVMLTWTEPPATNPNRPLLNDLDLTLIAPDGTTHQPYILDPLQPAANATVGENTRDNVEQVLIGGPAAGTWRILVRAKESVLGTQAFALTWTLAENPIAPCTTTVFPTSALLPETASTFTIQVARSSNCEPWSATTSSDWIQPGEATPNTTSGIVKIALRENASGSQRQGVANIAGTPVTFRQNTKCASQPITPGVTVNSALTDSDCFQQGEFGIYAKLFTFTARAGQRLSATQISNRFDSYLVLRGTAGNILAEDDDSAGGLNSRIPATGNLTLPLDGTYTLVATSFGSLETGAFSLSLTLQDGDGNTDALPKIINSCPAEINGTLTNTSSRTGRRGDLHLTDSYFFEGRIGQEIDLQVAEASFDSVLYLFSPNGSQLAFSDDSADSNRPRIRTTLTASGPFRLEVTSFSPFVSGTYKIQANGCLEWSFR